MQHITDLWQHIQHLVITQYRGYFKRGKHRERRTDRSQRQGQRLGFCHADAHFQQAYAPDCGPGRTFWASTPYAINSFSPFFGFHTSGFLRPFYILYICRFRKVFLQHCIYAFQKLQKDEIKILREKVG